ncbi:hypothetical protein JOC93_000638 [Priestia taiwanensis]|uniref:Uncharacterized protein n=1 Tax=Priestia taiwanensis TaxID=1347902 RepID=A0A917EMZ2_9BACI|nr:hypothetical protein [Priestia taiwanensis]GGE58747.1 hypothetical protein GCM10007140_06390 [Priestia taiwanensis]
MKEKDIIMLLFLFIFVVVFVFITQSFAESIRDTMMIIAWLVMFVAFLKQKRYLLCSFACVMLVILIYTQIV